MPLNHAPTIGQLRQTASLSFSAKLQQTGRGGFVGFFRGYCLQRSRYVIKYGILEVRDGGLFPVRGFSFAGIPLSLPFGTQVIIRDLLPNHVADKSTPHSPHLVRVVGQVFSLWCPSWRKFDPQFFLPQVFFLLFLQTPQLALHVPRNDATTNGFSSPTAGRKMVFVALCFSENRQYIPSVLA